MRKKKYAQGGSALSFQVGKAERMWPTPRRQPSQGIIPRVAVGIKDRVNRLKGLGNIQVPQCCARAFEILNK